MIQYNESVVREDVMNRLDEISIKILKYIAANVETNYDDLCVNFELTTKTVRKHINDLVDYIAAYDNVELIVKQGKGIQLIGDLSVVLDDLNNEKMQFSSSKTREIYVLTKLLESSEYIKIADLADEMYISRSTLETVLREIKNNLLPDNLHYKSNRNGIKIIGRESTKRKLLNETIDFYWGGLIASKKDEDLLLKIDFNENDFSLFDPKTFNEVSVLLNEFINDKNLDITEYEYQSLIIHLSIAINRLVDGHSIEGGESLGVKESVYAIELAQILEKTFSIKIPKFEVDYIALHINAIENKTMYENELDNENFNESEYYGELLSIIQEIFGVESIKAEPLNSMLLHLNAAIKRLKLNLSIKNPYTKDIKLNYPQAFSQSVTLANEIEERFNIELNDDELSYITLHLQMVLSGADVEAKSVVIVCSSGYGTAKFLEQRLINRFENKINITRTLSLSEFTKYQVMEDLIISTIPITNLLTPVVIVSPLLNEIDVIKIEKQLESQECDRDVFLELISEETTLISNKKGMKMEEVLKEITDCLIHHDFAEPGIYENTLARESLSSTGLGDFALPHSNIEFNKEPNVTIYINKNGIEWGNGNLKVVFFFGLNEFVKGELEEIYEYFNEFVSEKQNLIELEKCENYEEVRQIFIKGNCKRGA